MEPQPKTGEVQLDVGKKETTASTDAGNVPLALAGDQRLLTQHVLSRTESRETKETNISARVERGMQTLGAVLAEKARLSGWASDRIQEFLQPVEVVAENARNPRKNDVEALRRENPDPYAFTPEHPSFFAYDTLKKPDYGQGASSAASLYTNRRILDVPENISEGNMFSMLIIFHEMRHLLQDQLAREKQGSQYPVIQREAHSMRINGLRVQILREELEAYRDEIEGLNLLLDGRLASGELLHADAMSEILTLLHAEEAQIGSLRPLLFAAEGYYANSDRTHAASEFPPLFVNRCAFIMQTTKRVPLVSDGNSVQAMLPITDFLKQLGPSRIMQFR